MCNAKTRIKINKGIFAINEIAEQCFPIYTLAEKQQDSNKYYQIFIHSNRPSIHYIAQAGKFSGLFH